MTCCSDSTERRRSVRQKLEAAQVGDVFSKYSGDIEEREVSTEDWINAIKKASGELCLSFASAEGAHLISYSNQKGMIAIYSGPFGPENRPADISEGAVEQLIKHSDSVEVKMTKNTSLSEPPVRSLIKK